MSSTANADWEAIQLGGGLVKLVHKESKSVLTVSKAHLKSLVGIIEQI